METQGLPTKRPRRFRRISGRSRHRACTGGQNPSSERARTDPDLKRPIPDFSKAAWDQLKRANQLPALRHSHDYSPRRDGTGAAVPNVCLKIPTGGGKTLLGVSAVSRDHGRVCVAATRGFVLWIVPNEAIYAQTKRQLVDREHPFRQILDRAAAGTSQDPRKGLTASPRRRRYAPLCDVADVAVCESPIKRDSADVPRQR